MTYSWQSAVDLLVGPRGGELSLVADQLEAQLDARIDPSKVAWPTTRFGELLDSPPGRVVCELVESLTAAARERHIGAQTPTDGERGRALRRRAFAVLGNGPLGQVVGDRLRATGARVEDLRARLTVDARVADRQSQLAPVEHARTDGCSLLSETCRAEVTAAGRRGDVVIVAVEGLAYAGLEVLDRWLCTIAPQHLFVSVDRGRVVVGPTGAGGPARPAQPRVAQRLSDPGSAHACRVGAVLTTGRLPAAPAPAEAWPELVLYAMATLLCDGVVGEGMAAIVERTRGHWVTPRGRRCSPGLNVHRPQGTQGMEWGDRDLELSGLWQRPRHGHLAAAAVVSAAGADLIPHAVGTFKDHLLGVGRILRRWGLPPAICDAGTLHSVYGTAEFSACSSLGLLSFRVAPVVRGIVGPAAEGLAHLFCTVDRRRLEADLRGVDADSLRPTRVFNRFTGEARTLSARSLAAVLLLSMANLVEQTGPGGLPGGLAGGLSTASHMGQRCVGELDHAPPVFDACTGVMSADAEGQAAHAYAEADAMPAGDDHRHALLHAAIEANPWVAEPKLALAGDLIDAQPGRAHTLARRAVADLEALGAPWDKRAGFDDWLALGRRIVRQTAGATRPARGGAA